MKIESVYALKNGKLRGAVAAVSALMLCFFTLTACMTYAKTTGIMADIVSFGSDGYGYEQACANPDTLAENDYLVKVAERYQIVIRLIFTGGSIVPGYESAKNVKLIYDGNLMQIGEPSANNGRLYYPLECKSEFTCAAILIEDGEYHAEIIVSAVK